MPSAGAGPAAPGRWRLGRALAAAAALATRARGWQDPPADEAGAPLDEGFLEPAPAEALGLPKASGPHLTAPSATLGHTTFDLSNDGRRNLPAAVAMAAATAPPRPDSAASQLLRSGAAYQDQPRRPAAAAALRGIDLHATSFRQAMSNFGDVQYISHISVGHQQLTGILDTGSFELVVFSKNCPSCGRAGKYNPEESETYKKGILMSGQSYGSGTCYSSDAWDRVSIGQFESLNQSFWEVTDARMPILFNAAFQSIIGLGPPETPQSDAWNGVIAAVHNVSAVLAKGKMPPSNLTTKVGTMTTIATHMLRRRTILDNFHSPSFSVCIGKEPGSEGFFIWNDTSHLQKPGRFVRVPVVGKHTWSVKMTGARLRFKSQSFIERQLSGSYSMDHQTWWMRHKPLRRVKALARSFNASRNHVLLGCDDGCSALVDSGTSLLSVPTAIVDQLMIAVQKLHTNCSNIADLPHLVFELGGKEFSLPPDAYIVEVSSFVPSYLAGFVRVRSLDSGSLSKSHCELAVMETFSSGPYGPLWILGLPFFRNYYTTFSVGETKADRALYMAHAGPDCYPVDEQTALRQPVQLYARRVDLSKVWVPQTAAKAASSKVVQL